MRKTRWMGLAALALLAPGVAFGEGKEEQIPVKDLPKVIVTILNAMFPDGQIVEAERETETKGGKTVVEIEVTVKPKEGKAVEVEFTLDEKGQIKNITVEDDDDDEDDDKDDK
ncbi:MAG TPA: hypothetical protein PLE19_10965 [Planctomycetota bacterium]|nr:hypothetical protein [Planctomycetota bacterium]HRR81511.1 hypothetical protein [Planctomycetota bacterium]HRT92963.1 hypothetical protein [Planctomycetota bacterium]